MPQQRRRKFLHDPEPLVSVIAQHLDSPLSVRYREKITKGAADPERIKASTPLLLALRRVSPLPITHRAAVQALQAVAEARQGEWKMKPDEVDDWANALARRLRAMLRDIQQAMLKIRAGHSKCPAWARPFVDDSGEPGATTDAKVTDDGDDEEGEEEESAEHESQEEGEKLDAKPPGDQAMKDVATAFIAFEPLLEKQNIFRNRF